MIRLRRLFAIVTLSVLGVGGPSARLAGQDKSAAQKVETRIAQVFPDHTYTGKFVRSKGQGRAVLLLHGLRPQLNTDFVKLLPQGFKSRLTGPADSFAKANFSDWQRAGSPLVSHLSKHADVFAFAYGQNASLESIAEGPGLGQAVGQIKGLGYAEIVLMGHSAGGILARLFVEDNPAAGVTKVIQVCVPNGGTYFATLTGFAPKGQEAFVQSLTEESRKRSCQDRKAKKIPAAVQFLCVVGKVGKFGDGVVLCRCQWPEDLQEQGIPALQLPAEHLFVMSHGSWPLKLSLLVQEHHPRWHAKKVRAFKQALAEDEVTRTAYFKMIQMRAAKAHKETDVDALVACAYALAPYDAPVDIKEHLPTIYLKQAAQLTLAKNDKQEAERFLENTGVLQGLLGAETTDKVTTLACGRNLDTLLKREVVASREPIRKAGRDFFDADIATRGDDRDIAEALGKALVLAVRPTARIDGLANYKIGPKKMSATRMEIEMDFHGGTTRHRASITVTLSYERNQARIVDMVYRDDSQLPEERNRIEEFKNRFNSK